MDDNMALNLNMTCGLYDRSQPLIDGRVKPRDIDLDIYVNSDDRSRQRESREGKFDIAEFFTGIYMADLEQRTLGFTAIPIFVKRMFRHSYIYINKRAGIRTAGDLNGKRVGLQTWFTTTALWVRGILEEEYGVDLQSITWVANWAEKIGTWQPPPWLKLEIAHLKAASFTIFLSPGKSMPASRRKPGRRSATRTSTSCCRTIRRKNATISRKRGSFRFNTRS